MPLQTSGEAQVGQLIPGDGVPAHAAVPRAGEAAGGRSALGVGLVLFATVGWSLGGVFVHAVITGSQTSSLTLAFWRVLSTFFCLLLGLAVIRPRLLRIAPRDIWWLAGLGALAMGSFQALWLTSIVVNGLSVATIVQCNAPVIVTLLARLFWREPLTWQKWAALACAGLGTTLISLPGGGGNIHITALGIIIALGSAFAYGAITLFTKQLAGHYAQWTILVYAFGFATLALLPLQLGRPLPSAISGRAWLAFAALVLITTIGGYALYFSGLRRLPASVASIVAMAEVPLSAVWSYLFLGERLDLLQVLGALAVVSGVLLLSLRLRPRPGTQE